MKNKNPILVPELHEMPAGDLKNLLDLFESVNQTAGGGHGLPLVRLSSRVGAQSPFLLYRTTSVPPDCRTDPLRFHNCNPMPGRVAP